MCLQFLIAKWTKIAAVYLNECCDIFHFYVYVLFSQVLVLQGSIDIIYKNSNYNKEKNQ